MIYGEPIDVFISEKLRQRRENSTVNQLQLEVSWIDFITTGLRAGQDIYTLLLEYRKNTGTRLTIICEKILKKEKVSHISGAILQNSLENGTPCLEQLELIKENLKVRIKLERKLQSSTAQIRAQSYISVAVPFVFLLFLAILEPNFFQAIFSNFISKCIFFVAIFLALAGFIMICRTLTSVFSNNKYKFAEETKPTLLFYLLTFISSGNAPTCALEQAKIALTEDDRKELYKHSDEMRKLYQTLQNAEQLGAPIASTIKSLWLDSIEAKSFRWEETVNTCSLRLLIPLFLFIFPATMLFLFTPMLPMLIQL